MLCGVPLLRDLSFPCILPMKHHGTLAQRSCAMGKAAQGSGRKRSSKTSGLTRHSRIMTAAMSCGFQ